jgi:hypothetical protein
MIILRIGCHCVSSRGEETFTGNIHRGAEVCMMRADVTAMFYLVESTIYNWRNRYLQSIVKEVIADLICDVLSTWENVYLL